MLGITPGETANKPASLFQMPLDGGNAVPIYQFGVAGDPATINSSVILDGTTLYGSSQAGGLAGYGTIFSLDLQPRLTIQQSPSGTVVSWPSYASAYGLEKTADPAGPWKPISTPPLDNGAEKSFLTLPGTNKAFFRLAK